MDKTKPREYASPPCYLHELDPSYGGDVGAWRVQTRSQLIARRDGLSDQEHKRCSEEIIKHLADADVLSRHQRVGFYWPMAGEIDLRPLLTELTDHGVEAALPVIAKPKHPLEFWAWRPGDTLDESGLWGIPVPATRQLVEVTALLIPLVGFDDHGHRLGHGGGYYDRTLASMDPRPFAIGVGLEACRLLTIFPQAHDMAMDMIVTDAGHSGTCHF